MPTSVTAESASNVVNAAQNLWERASGAPANVEERVQGIMDRLFGTDLAPNNLPSGTTPGDRTVVGRETGISTDALPIDDAYDLTLYQEADGSYTAEVSMKLDFNFQSGTDAAGNTLEWTGAEKTRFIADFEQAIETVWDGRSLGSAPDGSDIRLDVNLDSRDAPFVTGENWEVNVTRIPAGGFARSSVSPGGKVVNLDSEDVVLTTKQGGFQQTGAAHEFGHMIGLRDEYLSGSPHIADTDSILHGGQVIENRHVQDFGDWVRAQLAN